MPPFFAMEYVAVHPRRRGEHFGLGQRDRYVHGSSPQARGTPDGLDLDGMQVRFIPAGAGNTGIGY